MAAINALGPNLSPEQTKVPFPARLQRRQVALTKGVIILVEFPQELSGHVGGLRRRSGEGGERDGLWQSGGVTLDTLPAIAAAGVDRVSIGALTHSAPALDIGLDYLR